MQAIQNCTLFIYCRDSRFSSNLSDKVVAYTVYQFCHCTVDSVGAVTVFLKIVN